MKKKIYNKFWDTVNGSKKQAETIFELVSWNLKDTHSNYMASCQQTKLVYFKCGIFRNSKRIEQIPSEMFNMEEGF